LAAEQHPNHNPGPVPPDKAAATVATLGRSPTADRRLWPSIPGSDWPLLEDMFGEAYTALYQAKLGDRRTSCLFEYGPLTGPDTS
jgi:hypothetical protein